MMKLYYFPGSCALAPHIALEHGGLDCEAVRVERGKQSEPEFLSINPLGRVPALAIPGRPTLTEVPAILSFVAECSPALGLLPPLETHERYEVLRWLAYLSSTVHPAFARLWRPERFILATGGRKAVAEAAAEQLADDFAHIDRRIGHGSHAVGRSLTVADFYLFVFGRWGFRLPTPTRRFPNLYRHTMFIAELPATVAAMKQQEITLEGPSSGPG